MCIALAFCIYVKYQLYILLPILKRNASDSVSPFLTWSFQVALGPLSPQSYTLCRIYCEHQSVKLFFSMP